MVEQVVRFGRTVIIIMKARKGGQTKTTVTANMAAALARMGFSVLVIETDGQGSLALMMGVQPEDGLYRLLAEDAAWDAVIRPVPDTFAGENLKLGIVPSSDMQMNIENTEWVGNAVYDRFTELRGGYDFVLVDTSPAINEVNSALMYTGDYLLLPTLVERPAVDMLRHKTLTYIEGAQAHGQAQGFPAAEILGIIPNRFDARSDTAKANLKYLTKNFGNRIRIFPPMRDLTAWNRAAQYRRSIFTFAEADDATNYEETISRHAGSELQRIVDEIIKLLVGVPA